MCGCIGGYWWLKQRLGGNVWQVQIAWGGRWGRTEPVGSAERPVFRVPQHMPQNDRRDMLIILRHVSWGFFFFCSGCFAARFLSQEPGARRHEVIGVRTHCFARLRTVVFLVLMIFLFQATTC